MIPVKSIWMDGAVRPYEDATTSVLSHSLHYGGAVYEGVRMYDGRPYRLREHMQRLEASAAHVGFALSASADEICEVTHEYLADLGTADAYVRTVAWRGEGIGVGGLEAPVHLAVAAWEWPPPFADIVDGIDLTWSRWRRPAPDTAPVKAKCSTLYTIGTLAAAEARDRGAHDALFLAHDGRLADATGANVFLVQGKTLVTPHCDDFLGGITRQAILDAAPALGLDVVVRDVWPDEVGAADEMFLCGTAHEVVPVRRVDDRRFATSEVGRMVRDWYAREVRDV